MGYTGNWVYNVEVILWSTTNIEPQPYYVAYLYT